MRVLVVSHDASRTGAPLLLLTILRWLRQAGVELQLVLWRGGPLVDDFAEVADVTVLHPPPGRRSPAETVELALAKLRLGALADRLSSARVRRRLAVRPHDVRYLNGAGSALVLPHLPGGAPSVAHVHELRRGLTFSLRGPGREPFLAAERIVAVANVVADELIQQWGVDPARIVVRHGCLPAEPPPDRGAGTTQSGARRGAGPLVGSVGAGSWRKGVDLFLAVAEGVHRARGDVRFAWVGALDDEAAVRADAQRRGLTDVLDLPGGVGDVTPWYAEMAVFCSTAREDPFPLVGLEAGAAGVPVVAFANGGIVELLDEGRGTVVGPEDVPAMAAAVLAALADPGATQAATEALREHIDAHHRIEQLGPALLGDLEAVAGR